MVIEHPRIDAVAHHQVPPDAPHNSRKAQDTDQRIGLVISHPLPQVYLAIKIEQSRHIHFAAQDALAHENQVVVPVAGLPAQEELARQAIHGLDPRQQRRNRLARDGLIGGWTQPLGQGRAQTLGQVRMSPRPEERARQQALGGGVVGAQTPGQRGRFHRGEVVQLDAAPNIEGGRARVTDEIVGGRHAEQAEGQPLKSRLPRTAVVTLADGCKKLVG